MATTVMEHNNLDFAPTNDRDTLYFLGGVALMVFGAGLILSNPVVRKYLGQMGIGNLAQSALPDIERYMRLRNM
ncbi:MAG TPA: hypothetical protein VMS18_15475 [Candidatus Binatia bacterium]|nr:hypothetical protein [Candidatus Binatia bacterium]